MGRNEALTKVLYPGSFDPPHNGHLEIITTASRLFDEVVVAAMRNPGKGEPLFGMDDRRAMLEESVAHLPNVSVTMFSELVVDRGSARRKSSPHKVSPPGAALWRCRNY
jgi:pantetheine-phosphate adenylyltransferase